MRKRVKRCEICSSKLDKNGNCTWGECPKNLAKKQNEATNDKKNKEEK